MKRIKTPPRGGEGGAPVLFPLCWLHPDCMRCTSSLQWPLPVCKPKNNSNNPPYAVTSQTTVPNNTFLFITFLSWIFDSLKQNWVIHAIESKLKYEHKHILCLWKLILDYFYISFKTEYQNWSVGNGREPTWLFFLKLVYCTVRFSYHRNNRKYKFLFIL